MLFQNLAAPLYGTLVCRGTLFWNRCLRVSPIIWMTSKEVSVFSERVQQTKNLKIVKILTLKSLLQSQQSLTLCHQERPAEVVSKREKGTFLILYNRGGQTFFTYGTNFIKILFCGPQKKFFGVFSLKYYIIDATFGYFSYINS